MRRAVPYIVGAVLCAAALSVLAVLSLEDVKGYSTVWLAADTVLIWYFTLGYGFLSRWYDSEVGVHLLLFSAAISVTFANLLYLRLAKGATAAPEGLVVISGFYVILGFLFAWRAVIFTKAQIDARRGRHERMDVGDVEGDAR